MKNFRKILFTLALSLMMIFMAGFFMSEDISVTAKALTENNTCYEKSVTTKTASHTDSDSDKICDTCENPTALYFGSSAASVYWELNSESTLIIYGTGAMNSYYSYSSYPWYNYRTDIKNIIISDGVTSIGNYAFDYCNSLESVTIGASVTSIGEEAFFGCGSLKSVYISDLEKWFNISFSDYYSNPLYYAGDLYINNELATDITIPDSVTSIGNYAFCNCTSLESVTIGDSVTSIGKNAFYNCTSLESVYISDLEKWLNISFGNYSSNPLYYAGDLYINNELATDITIPDSVTSIGYSAFSGCTSLESINIPDSVTSIGNYAFYGCKSLESINIPDSVTSIGDFAFYDCTSLESVNIPDSVTSIGDSAFVDCTSLESVYISDLEKWFNISFGGYFSNPLHNGADLYINNKLATDITIPSSVTVIETQLRGCTSLKSITIPDSVTSIGDSAFDDCTSLKSITIPDSVTSIGKFAFDDCTSLESVYISDLEKWFNISFGNFSSNPLYYATDLYINNELATDITIPSSVTVIETQFRGCTSLKSITIPDSVTSIGDSAFYGCTSLESVNIPDGVTSIGNYAFYGCTPLESINIPDSVTSIGWNAFYNCTSLESVYISDLEKWFNISFGDTYSNPLHYAGDLYINNELATDITIPSSVTVIETQLRGCTSLKSITIPDSVTSIGEYAFMNCRSLESINIGDSVTSIGSRAFDGCYSLESINIGDSVTSIGEYAFDGCTSLESITIPDSVISIGSRAFYGCYSLRCVIYDGTEENWNGISIEEGNDELTNAKRFYLKEPTVYSDGKAIFNKNKTMLLFHYDRDRIYTVPEGVRSLEQNSFEYSDKPYAVILPESLKNIGAYAFGETYVFGARTHKLNAIYIPVSVTAIDQYAFYSCRFITDVYYGGTKEQWKKISIGSDNTNLTSAEIHYSTKLVESDGVIYTEDMKTLVATSDSIKGTFTVPATVTKIAPYAFSGLEELIKVRLPDSVTSIGDNAFLDCTALEEISFGSKLTAIGNSAFKNCSRFTKIQLPDSVSALGTACFSGCKQLAEINIPSSLANIPDGAFIECEKLTEIRLHGSVKSIGRSAFSGCTSLSDISFPSSLEKISAYAFKGCEAMTYVSLPDSVNSLEENVFSGCKNISDICLPEGKLSKIPQNAFNGCEKLTNIYIPKNITSFGDSAFLGCSNLSDVYYNGTEDEWNKISIVSSNSVLWAANIHFLHAHKNTGWTVLTNPAHHSDGIKSSVCETCRYEIRTTIPRTHTEKTISETKATCTAKGYTAGIYCEECARYLSGHEEIPATGHSTASHGAKAPTCTDKGWNAYVTCKNCSYTTYSEIPATGHSTASHGAKAPTCTEKGWNAYVTCRNCSYTTYSEIPATGHSTASHGAKAPTCTEKGWNAYVTCMNCSYTTYSELPVNSSNHRNTKNTPAVSPTTESAGYTAGVYCEDCKKYISGHTEIPRLEASFTDSGTAVKKDNTVLAHSGLTARELLSQASKNSAIVDSKGKKVADNAKLCTGMTLTLSDGKTLTISVAGDTDGDGDITAADARLALRAAVGLDKLSSAQTNASVIDKSSEITAAHARLILRASVGLEDTKSWIKK